eukprot:14825-Heterococcus_DN1.PRE.2
MTPVLLTLSRTTAAAASSSTSSSSSISNSKVQEDAVVFTSAVTSALSQFETGMDDDLNGPRAAAGLFALIKLGEKVRSNGFLQLVALVFTTATEEYLYLLSFLGFTFAYINHSIGYVYCKTIGSCLRMQVLSSVRHLTLQSTVDVHTDTHKQALKDGSMTPEKATQLLQALDKIDFVLGIFYQPPGFEAGPDSTVEDGETGSIPAEVTALLEQRAAAKAAKDWAAADSVRAAITALGYSVKDVAGGSVQVTKLPQE